MKELRRAIDLFCRQSNWSDLSVWWSSSGFDNKTVLLLAEIEMNVMMDHLAFSLLSWHA